MKVRVIVDSTADEEIVIHCNHYSSDIAGLQQMLERVTTEPSFVRGYQQETEYYINLDDVLFFQSEGRDIYAHTSDASYMVKQKLYELESQFARRFVRVSKSAMVNATKIYAVNRSLTYWMLEFRDSVKTLSVSRSYFQSFKYHLEEKRKI